MKPVLATCLLLAMTLSHEASALCGHRAVTASTDSHAANAPASDHAAMGHGSDPDTEQDRHECSALMDCGVVAVAPSTAGPSQWVGSSSFPLRHLTGSIESELPPTESPPPRQS